MTRFRNRFAVVLKARERDRDVARAALAAALRTSAEAEAARRAVEVLIASERGELGAATRAGRVDVSDWLARRRHASVLTAERKTAAAAVADAAAQVAEARTALIAADRAVAALETLRDRDLRAHRTAELAAEQRAVEDLFTATAAAFVGDDSSF
ncbi:flagellar FliJ family protein [Alienimonas californiensis]|uniref:Flagellar FliJ protein n=1 Tax=Alienimonas californiensis TaxID=2527989 RepID=A0A517PE38_9PLAN|nr:flagellar FliJ family protein [Alienimonas californiensis]QDT17638.1 Flagellar FliJ protein [Alienimonas californiensis]